MARIDSAWRGSKAKAWPMPTPASVSSSSSTCSIPRKSKLPLTSRRSSGIDR